MGLISRVSSRTYRQKMPAIALPPPGEEKKPLPTETEKEEIEKLDDKKTEEANGWSDPEDEPNLDQCPATPPGPPGMDDEDEDRAPGELTKEQKQGLENLELPSLTELTPEQQM